MNSLLFLNKLPSLLSVLCNLVNLRVSLVRLVCKSSKSNFLKASLYVGYDDIVYTYLVKMPSLHKALATAFTRIRDEGVAPDSWGASKIILLKKNHEDSDHEPTNFRMISLTLNIGKLYHTLESQRTMQFMLENKYLDPSAQKAYIDGINGCVEHVIVVQEVLQHVKLHKKTMHLTGFDLEDAFGSVPHMLIPHVMSHYYLPKPIITYITSLYTKLQGKVCTKEWETEFFKFLKGVFQGDPYSGVIFLIIFNPIVEYIKKHKETHGYKLTTSTTSAINVITTPFADDFNIITHNKTMHQTLVTDVEKKLKSMGLVIKPKKCRSLSIQGGKAVNIPFRLKDKDTGEDVNIASVIEKPMKFLGSEVSGTNSPNAMFASLYSKLKGKLDNIDKSTLRGEHKCNIYSRYALPSIRFYFSLHQIHKSHEVQLDSLARGYLKKWLGIQKHGVTDTAIFHPYMLCVKAPSQLYKEAHAGNYAIVRTKGDKIVNHALDSRLERETAWTRKNSTLVEVDKMWKTYQEKTPTNSAQDEESYEVQIKDVKIAKKFMKDSVKQQTLCEWNTRVKKTNIPR